MGPRCPRWEVIYLFLPLLPENMVFQIVRVYFRTPFPLGSVGAKKPSLVMGVTRLGAQVAHKGD
jgi:hypothetical protein